MKKNNKVVEVVSLEELQQQEYDLLVPTDEDDGTSGLLAEQELDFESVQEREYEPEVWEVLNEDEQPDQ